MRRFIKRHLSTVATCKGRFVHAGLSRCCTRRWYAAAGSSGLPESVWIESGALYQLCEIELSGGAQESENHDEGIQERCNVRPASHQQESAEQGKGNQTKRLGRYERCASATAACRGYSFAFSPVNLPSAF